MMIMISHIPAMSVCVLISRSTRLSSSRNSSLKINATEPSTLITETAKSVNSVVDSTVAAVVAGETAVLEETKVTSE